VPLEEPSWWYGASEDDLRVRALRPISGIFGWAAQRRLRNAIPYQSKLPVICVGNFTAGGTGKTPLSLMIAALLKERGAKPAFLTRGYSGRKTGPVWVNPSADLASDVGDEPLLLADCAPTMVARDRAKGAQEIEASRMASHIIMDDGLQNPSLAKALSIAVVDAVRGLGNGEVIPAGPLRAPIDFQFGLVDAVVVNGDASGSVLRELKGAFPGPVLSAAVTPNEAAGSLSGIRVVAFSGIGNPARFTSSLGDVGAKVISARAFKDHHDFTDMEAQELIELAAASDAQLVTTEKDLARLKGRSGACGRLAQTTRVLGIQLTMEPRDLARLEALVQGISVKDKASA
jgi:tetraacyldisaccharide 4'-kinase